MVDLFNEKITHFAYGIILDAAVFIQSLQLDD